MIKIAKQYNLDYISKIESKNFINPWSKNQFMDYILDLDSYNLVYIKKNMISGYLFGKIIDNCYHVYKVSVKEDLINTGIGSLLVKYMIKYIKGLNLYCIYLEVGASNIIAIRLYENFGFKKVNIRKKYYANNEDALLYNLILE